MQFVTKAMDHAQIMECVETAFEVKTAKTLARMATMVFIQTTVCYVPVSVIYQNSSVQDPNGTITWEAPQNKCPVIDYAVQYQLVRRDLCEEVDGEFKTLHNTTERQSSLSHPDSSLEPNSVYKVRVLARNEAGLGEFQENNYIEHTTPEKGRFLVGGFYS